MTFSNALRQALLNCGQSHIAIERATGVSRDSISRFLRGKTLHLDVADRLAAHLGISFRTSVLSSKERQDRPMQEALLAQFADALRNACPRLARSEKPRGHHLRIGDESIERYVDLEVINRTKPDRLEVGLSFNSDSRALNDRNATRFRSYLQRSHPPFRIEDRSTTINRYLTAVFPVPEDAGQLPEMIRFAVDAALWFEGQSYANVPTETVGVT